MKADRTLRKIADFGGVATFTLVILLANAGVNARSQAAGGAQTPSAPTPRSRAPLDLTGYWVSVVTEDWRFRMIVPDKGDYSSVPLNPEGRKVADSWDPAKDQAEGNQCRSYGAAGLMRIPGRLHIQWENDNTLKSRHRLRRPNAAAAFRCRASCGGSTAVAGLFACLVGGTQAAPAPHRASGRFAAERP
jgi:hypothetical protein